MNWLEVIGWGFFLTFLMFSALSMLSMFFGR